MSFPARVAVACLLAGLVAGAGLLSVPAAADPGADPGSGEPDPARTVARADRILDGDAGATGDGRVDATLALRDVFVARPTMGFVASLWADVLLARPTDGRADPGGDGYTRPAVRRCSQRFCVHFVKRGADAPASTAWVRRTLRVLEEVWRLEVRELGYRRPPADGRRGGDRRFDVYLADLGSRGIFGYCTPERRVRGERFAASSYCVLDNDFARRQYGAGPRRSLRVTAAHEFFHAIQFGYDFREDPWLLESTATWVEERFADGADDNRRYLPYGTVRRPGIPLDRFSNLSYAHYGNWAFWEFLARRHGDDVVRAVWRRADTVGDAPDEYSVQALARVLQGRGGIRRALAAYAVANLDPARSYPEGAHWPAARVRRPADFDRGRPRARRSSRTVSVDHLAAQHLAYHPSGRGPARLRIAVDGPGRRSTVRVVVERTDGGSTVRTVRRDARGRGTVRVAFSAGAVDRVVVTLVNHSSRYQCGRRTGFACGGVPRDDDKGFRVDVEVLPG
ncbi:MXAN_6640 family putative metalloprotease [Nocardioides sp. TF02-7]|uniref:MXAN_6640 family putative metalloprotease n=1 Tax=Nocardioides sp. TF02-7 TaxID=2917724 RepID=UPI001F060A98|nr:MXAN_6640 family putative metalloprotease [Nocardioides sp. TF02-7]UMG91931.1 hypothetical protein MF408_18195 [Nocardioides sp. TF02-7]